MTVCNMSIEAGARAGMVAPDDVTFDYIQGRPYAPKNEDWDKAVALWKTMHTDDGAVYGKTVTLEASALEPMITYGTNPGMGMPISGRVPDPKDVTDANQRTSLEKALKYMGFQPGESLLGKKVDVVFIGSCTNGRIFDLRAAAGLMKGKKVADGMRVLIVPGSQAVKQAEDEGLDRSLKKAALNGANPAAACALG